ncbi:GNAT family N-acetyltransferase [Virgibacillus siamensis]|uniref:GNAT family N-acetyltransferase n=1 Tax=Virgibacillus siamensis TaxID=480071 RepID=UPI00098500D3|nr:GNAT family N-acetyltransferase [Virgibacillus siamensis]
MNLTTENLKLRPYEDNDECFLASMLADPEIMRFIGDGRTKDENGIKNFLDWIYHTYERGSEFGLHVMVRKDGIPVGHAGLVPQVVSGINELEIGYWINRPYWRLGYATEVATALKRYGLQKLGAPKLIALIQPGNSGSKKVAEKIGMHVEKEIVLSGRQVLVYAVYKNENR